MLLLPARNKLAAPFRPVLLAKGDLRCRLKDLGECISSPTCDSQAVTAVIFQLDTEKTRMAVMEPMHRRSSALRDLICRIDVSAFAAVMFVLVSLFLARVALVHSRDRISVDLAKVSNPASVQDELREDVMEVAVTRDGQIYYGLDHVDLYHLPDSVRRSLRQGAERRVYIRADVRARYGDVKQVLDEVRSAGVQDIVLIVDRKPTQPEVPGR